MKPPREAEESEESRLPKPRPSVLKRQREQAKREKKALKAEKKALRGTEDDIDDIENMKPLEGPVHVED